MSNPSVVKQAKLHSWGRLKHESHQMIAINRPEDAIHLISKQKSPCIAYGMGRSYGDVCLNPNGVVLHTKHLNHMISFDEQTGILHCESGVLLRDIQQLFIKRGFILPVTPGTQFVTIGGAIANDVHGKNHHVRGTFGHHILSFRLAKSNGEIIDCKQGDKLFEATIGGLGLTGLILDATIQLMPTPGPWLETETIVYEGIEEFYQLSQDSYNEWEYVVSWIDCLSGDLPRGILIRGNHEAHDSKQVYHKKKISMPITPPISLVNNWSLKIFNALYFHSNKRKQGKQISHFEPFFYPLDHVHQWNRMYGPKGFYQYQVVIPHEGGVDAIKEMLRVISRSKQGSFLAVLKILGNIDPIGMLSFSIPGLSLALDFPNLGQKTLDLFSKLDTIVKEADGRIYPAKDARMPEMLFKKSYTKLDEFLKYRDPNISSVFSKRVMGS